MPQNARACLTVGLVLLASCSRGAKTRAPAPAQPATLAGYASQRIIVTPTARVRSADSLHWTSVGGARAAGVRLDDAVAARLRDRGLGARFILAPDLVRTFERNRTYASDPSQLAVEPLRAATFIAGSKYGEPLSSQLRTMIALHEDARYVLLPIELRFDGAQAVLRAALLDPRYAEARWVGEVRSDSSAAATAAQSLAQLSSRLADLFVAP